MANTYLDRLYQVIIPIYIGLLAEDTRLTLQGVDEPQQVTDIAKEAVRLAKILLIELDKEGSSELTESILTVARNQSESLDTFSSRNLLYHLTPMEDYQHNLELLFKYWDRFTGKKVIAVAQGEWLENIEIVKRLFPKKDKQIEFIDVRNNKKLREGVSFTALLRKASRFPADSVTFYAHSKGVTRNSAPGVKLWTEAMHYYNLENINGIEEMLKAYPVAGVFKRKGAFPHFPKESKWHYSGTFFWFRNKDLFKNPKWAMVPRSRYGVESYLSLLFQSAEAGSLGPEFTNKDGYDHAYLKALLIDAKYPGLK